jgi:hypothetical protein
VTESGARCSTDRAGTQRTSMLRQLRAYNQSGWHNNSNLSMGWQVAGLDKLPGLHEHNHGSTAPIARGRPWRVLAHLHAFDPDHRSFVDALHQLQRSPASPCAFTTLLVWRQPSDWFVSAYVYEVVAKHWQGPAQWHKEHRHCADTSSGEGARGHDVLLGPSFEQWVRATPNPQSALLLHNEQFLLDHGKLAAASRSAGWAADALARAASFTHVAPAHRLRDLVRLLCARLGLSGSLAHRCPALGTRNAAKHAEFDAITAAAAASLARSSIPECAAMAPALEPRAQRLAMRRLAGGDDGATSTADSGPRPVEGHRSGAGGGASLRRLVMENATSVDAAVYAHVEHRFVATLAAARAVAARAAGGPDSSPPPHQPALPPSPHEPTRTREAALEWRYFALRPGEVVAPCAASRIHAVSGKLVDGVGQVLVHRAGRPCNDAWSRNQNARARAAKQWGLPSW